MFSKLRRYFSKSTPQKTFATAADATAFIADLFRGHGQPVTLRSGWVVSDVFGFSARARIFTNEQLPPNGAIQLDVEVKTSVGQSIVESVAGFGATMHEAIINALRAFAEGSFHQIFSALTGKECSHCEVELWPMGGASRRVFIGPMTQRVAAPETGPAPIDWFPVMEAQIKSLPLSPAMHWVRFYHAEIGGRDAISEALLDNMPMPALRDTLAAQPWPKTAGFYSVRLFMILGAEMRASD